jgi:hypothetical protein
VKTNWGWGLLLGSLLGSPASGGLPAAESAPRIAIRSVNSAKVPQRNLLEGQKKASYILEQAGVVLTWQDCSAGSKGWQSASCLSELGANEFWLHVAMWKPAVAGGDLLGFTALNRDPGGQMVAGVYYPAVKSMEHEFDAVESDVLGAVLAHEIGHLLGVGHSVSGVMCPHFGRNHIESAGRGGLLFSTLQAGQIRAEIARRSDPNSPTTMPEGARGHTAGPGSGDHQSPSPSTPPPVRVTYFAPLACILAGWRDYER